MLGRDTRERERERSEIKRKEIIVEGEKGLEKDG